MTDRPRITLVVASTVDGKISTSDGAGPRFTSPRDKALLRRLRGETDAVILGAGTVAADDPPFRLPADIRAARLRRNQTETPVRAVLSARATVSPSARMFQGHTSPAVVFVGPQASREARDALAAVAEVAEVHDVGEAVAYLAERHGVRSILLEGGSETSGAFLEAGLIDEVYLTLCPVLVGGRDVPTPIGGDGLPLERAARLRLISTRIEEGELFLHYRVERTSE
ncbi:hypothetical protein FJZ36_03000 [Candidatus Poribacteria bacterium]|nr:hypothetical protein [Candidatus Poribacteria bacterium]